LLGLVDKSLVLVEERDGEARYRLLETLREYARAKLDASGESSDAHAAHAAYFAGWAGGPGPQPVAEVIEREGALAVGSVAGEADNLRAALGYFLEQGDAEAGLGMAARIYHLWFLRGPREEGRAWLRRFLAAPDQTRAPSRTAALFAAGFLAEYQGDLAEAHACFAEAAALAQARGDRPGRAHAQTQLGAVAFLRGEFERARAELEEGTRLAREADAPEALLESLLRVGVLAVAQEDLPGARQALVEGLAVLPHFQALSFRFHWLAGDLALAEGQGERAAREYRAALADRPAAGDPVGVAISALGLAEVAAAAGQGARAARLLGGSEGLALGVGDRPITEPGQRAQHTRVEAAARELLGEEAFAALQAEGRRLGLVGVVRLALADL
jgi:non-specific serine/threonine protein kinase